MDTTISPIYKLPSHEHPLFFSAMFIYMKCDGCEVEGVMYGSYFCNEDYCNRRFHKDCVESPLEINHHPFHPEHTLLLNKMSRAEYGTPCDFCGRHIWSTYYTCPTCKFKVHLICGTKPSELVIEHPVCHDHTLVFLKEKDMEEDEVSCELCKESINGHSYSCIECNNVYFHLDCVHLSKEIDHSCHSSHPLKIMPAESLMDNDAQKNCHFCCVQPKNMLYHCPICNFTLCLGCTKRPAPLVVDDAKTHTHPLTLFSSKITFTCKVAGIEIDSHMSYICLKCDFVVYGYCVGLPRIITINRHDHRIAFTHHFGHKGAKCGVCRKSVSQYYGAYSCSICPEYVVHSRCATDFKLWNGVELEGIPETSEDIASFKVMGDNLICHFMHDTHILLLLKDYDMVGDDYYESQRLRCEACVSPIRFGPVYSCQECHFFLHEKCAYLPMKKNLVFAPTPYKLEYLQGEVLLCGLCGIYHGGFTYILKGQLLEYPVVDVHCSSISEPFIHSGHLHPLYILKTTEKRNCNACRRYRYGYILTCSDCDFDLCFYCATLPEKIWHISDEHPLTLHYGGKEATSKNWCEVCEMELDSSKWFFTCSDCGVTLHVQCVLGDFPRFHPNCSFSFCGKKYFVVLNNQNSRPFCSVCHRRCKAPVILQVNDEHNRYICSLTCCREWIWHPLEARRIEAHVHPFVKQRTLPMLPMSGW